MFVGEHDEIPGLVASDEHEWLSEEEIARHRGIDR